MILILGKGTIIITITKEMIRNESIRRKEITVARMNETSGQDIRMNAAKRAESAIESRRETVPMIGNRIKRISIEAETGIKINITKGNINLGSVIDHRRDTIQNVAITNEK